MSTAESHWDQVFEALGNSRKRIAIVVTGGGTGAIARCFRREGASKNFIEGAIPYSHPSVTEYLGCPLSDASASDAAARQLAAAAMQRVKKLDNDPDDQHCAAGIALVAALPTTPQRRGQDRIHVVLRTHQHGWQWSLEMTKGAFTRQAAETLADEMIYRALAELAEIPADKRFLEDAGLPLAIAHFAP